MARSACVLGLALLVALVQPAAASERSHVAAARADSVSAARKKARTPADTAFGREGDPRKVKRTVTIEMSDAMRYFPDQIHVKKGQTVQFNLRNAGELPHEMVLGTMDDLKKHAGKVKQSPDFAADDPNVARVEPGATGALVWQFTRAGEFYYGCLVPGHFEAGMIGTVVVR
jgi:uncharacterized cupredoxin-like copper-binding protein